MNKNTLEKINKSNLHEEGLNNEEKSRREFLFNSLVIGGAAITGLGGLGLSGCSKTEEEKATVIQVPEDEIVRIGYLPITDATALLTAHAMGLFEKQGLKAVKPTLIRGWSPLIEGFSAGKFNLVHFLKPIAIWMRYNNEFPVKVMSWAHTNGSGLVVGKDTNIKSYKDLGGKQVAVPFWYSIHNIILQMELRRVGLTPVIQSQSEPLKPNEVNLQILPPPDMPPALAAKKVDAFTVAEPFNAAGELLAGGKMLRFTGDIWKDHPCCVICMNENQINAKPEWTQKVMNALVEAQFYAHENKKEVAHMLSKDGKAYLPMKANVVERAMTHYHSHAYPSAIQNVGWGNGRIDFQPWPYPSATERIVSELKHTLVGGDGEFLKALDPKFVSQDLVDYEFVKKAIEVNGGVKRIPGVDLSNPFSRTEKIKL